MSEKTSTARKRADGPLVRVLPDGTEQPLPVPASRPMTGEEIEAAALSDPDAQLLTEEQLARAQPASRVKRVRRALGLTQEEFAARFGLSLATLRDWEQGRYQPDQAARSYLAVIERAPDAVIAALGAGSDLAAER